MTISSELHNDDRCFFDTCVREFIKCEPVVNRTSGLTGDICTISDVLLASNLSDSLSLSFSLRFSPSLSVSAKDSSALFFQDPADQQGIDKIMIDLDPIALSGTLTLSNNPKSKLPDPRKSSWPE